MKFLATYTRAATRAVAQVALPPEIAARRILGVEVALDEAASMEPPGADGVLSIPLRIVVVYEGRAPKPPPAPTIPDLKVELPRSPL